MAVPYQKTRDITVDDPAKSLCLEKRHTHFFNNTTCLLTGLKPKAHNCKNMYSMSRIFKTFCRTIETSLFGCFLQRNPRCCI